MPTNWQNSIISRSYQPQELIDTAMAQKQRVDQERQQNIDQAMADLEYTDPLKAEQLTQKMEAARLETEAKRLAIYKETQTMRETSAFLAGVPQLEKTLSDQGHTVGTRGYADGYLDYVAQVPLARSTQLVQDITKTAARVHDDQAMLNEKMALLKNAGFSPTSADITAESGVNLRGSVKGSGADIPATVLERYARVKGAIQRHQDLSLQEEKSNRDANKAGIPYTGAADLHANQTEAGLLEKNFPQLSEAPAASQSSITAPTSAVSEPAGTPALSPQDQAAIAWATANPDDPRAAQIKSLHGQQ
jgi:hypothetical protein